MNTLNRIISCLDFHRVYENHCPTADSRLAEDLGFDSMTTMEFIMDVETEFDFIIEDDCINGLKTLGDVATLVDSLIEPERKAA